MKRMKTGKQIFELPCGCHMRKTTCAYAWEQCDLHKAAPAMLKALDRVLLARRTGDGCGVLGWDVFYECGDAVKKANQRETDKNLREAGKWLQNEIAEEDRRLRSKKVKVSFNKRAA